MIYCDQKSFPEQLTIYTLKNYWEEFLVVAGKVLILRDKYLPLKMAKGDNLSSLLCGLVGE